MKKQEFEKEINIIEHRIMYEHDKFKVETQKHIDAIDNLNKKKRELYRELAIKLKDE
jgi:hypothetical protein